MLMNFATLVFALCGATGVFHLLFAAHFHTLVFGVFMTHLLVGLCVCVYKNTGMLSGFHVLLIPPTDYLSS